MNTIFNNVENVDFATLASAISDDDAKEQAFAIANALDERATYENAKNSDNDSIQKHIANARAKLATVSVARVFLAASVPVSYFNASERVTARTNVYAIAKLADFARFVCDLSKSDNAITRACVKSLFSVTDAGIEFTHKLALACASDKMPIEEAKARKLLTRHTVSAGTASTQASSTMSALLAAHVVSEFKNEKNETAYKLCDNALVSHLRALYA